MNNNSENISRYLNNEMDAAEKAAFENALTFDATLKKEVHTQKLIMQAAIDAGIREEFRKVMQQKPANGGIVKWIIGIAACLLIALVFTFRDKILHSGDIADQSGIAILTTPFIAPPMPDINVPFSEYSFDAEKGFTIFHPTGSILKFPASSLVDAAGNLIIGRVKVKYREFTDPVDFFVSGIPMNYDSAGRKYQFESSGMCEIHVFKDDKPVLVNKNAPPQIHLSSANKSPDHNLYYLDTAARNWNFIGKDKITSIADLTETKSPVTGPLIMEAAGLPPKPVMPAKANDDKQSFSIAIDPGSFKELSVYDKLKFQVEDQSTYNRADADEHWDSVKLFPSGSEGVYTIEFTNPRRKVSYKVKPVLEGDDYNAALKSFRQRNAVYESALQQKVARNKAASDSIVKLNKRNEDKFNADSIENDLIIARNNYFRELRQGKIDTTNRFYMEMQARQEVYRSFTLNSFGIWNCDNPLYFQNSIPITAYFVDSNSSKLTLFDVAVVYGDLNGIIRSENNTLRLKPGKRNMIWSTRDKYFYYLTYNDFARTGIDLDTKYFTFTMRRSPKPITSYQEIRELVGVL